MKEFFVIKISNKGERHPRTLAFEGNEVYFLQIA
jgi:hypothetical protein